ncbi:sulfurtransferase-like selenium metabolism protein YedF [Helicobacter jaachi]|uniref:Sulfurtransferase-like selenium metabolism protein YedF n=1 Tax=Helicobacter jaachi TaxID=1677920 RepID=A0A4V6I2D9_9HELI|nr:sulfurtransferase-like selenium metabolism protein YedF [Helicobacter jaachi]TLD95722.1 sulfurtransferase-like selenium metabolism protein YedF [Helicobacter jaachi]
MNDTIQINVCNLPCPEPVLKVKKALLGVNEHSLKLHSYEIIGNSPSSKENLMRFLSTEGFEFEVGFGRDEQFMIILKSKANKHNKEGKDKILPKMMLIKSDRVGEGELGGMLIHGFIKSLLQTDVLPQKMLFVNRGVLLTTDNKEVENTEIVEVLKELEKQGVEIYSCGSCLSYFALTERLKVGMIGNAIEGVQNMLLSDSLISL